VDVVDEVKRLTGGGADVSIEALGTPQTFETSLLGCRLSTVDRRLSQNSNGSGKI